MYDVATIIRKVGAGCTALRQGTSQGLHLAAASNSARLHADSGVLGIRLAFALDGSGYEEFGYIGKVGERERREQLAYGRRSRRGRGW